MRNWQAEYQDTKKFFSLELRKHVGKSADWIITKAGGGQAFNAVLIGPVPEVPFTQQPVERLQFPSGVDLYWGTERDSFEYFGLSEK